MRVERPHAPYFRYTGPGQLTAKEAASIPTTPGAKLLHKIRGYRAGPPARIRGGGRRTALQGQGPGHLQLGCHLVVGLRDRGDPAGVHRSPGPPWPRSSSRSRSRSPSRSCSASSRSRIGRSCIAYPNGGGSYSVSKANFGPARVARRRVGAAHRLQPDRRRLDVIGRGADRLGRAGARPGLRRHRGRRHHPDDDRQPARPARGGQHLRRPDLPVPRQRLPDDRPGPVPDRRPRRDAGALTGGPRRRPGHDADRRHPGPAARVLVGCGRADRHRSDRDRRAGVQAAGVEERGDDAAGDGRRSSACCSSGITFLATNFGILPSSARRKTVIAQVAAVVFGGEFDRFLPVPDLHRVAAVPRREHVVQRLPASGRRARRRTASSLASSPSAATGWPSRAGSSHWGSSRPRSW